ncbi:MAG: DNA topoisomerase III [Gilliamella apicola]|nr:DNA topoisomerase III [Gilliamella apicola]
MKLFICEKPSQAKDIQKHIGATLREDGFFRDSTNQINLTWCIGHLLELAEPETYDEKFKKWNIDDLPILPRTWVYNVAKKTSKQYKVIQKLVKKANTIIIATDPDREGEAIAWSLLERFNWHGETKRLWFSALDDASIKKALANLKTASETYPLYLAAQARAKADWVVGLNSTRLFTLLGRNSGLEGVLSVGRVQTPVLKLIVDRDREIKNFIPKPYFSININLSKSTQTFNAIWIPENHVDEAGRCINESYARQLAQILNSSEAKVINVKIERVKSSPPLAYSLSDLQKACSKKYGMSMSQVLDIAQSLYEKHKITTYPRTDCGYLPESMFDEAKDIVSVIVKNDSEMAKFMPQINLEQKSRVWNDKKVTAHHGIIPTTKIINLSLLSSDELKVYDLIRRNYLANFMLHNEVDKTVVDLLSANEKFQAKGSVQVELGWRVLFVKDDIENVDDLNDKQELPILSLGDNCTIVKADVRSLHTKPPSHFDDSSLLDAMKQIAKYIENPQLKKMLKETSGIGTEATRAGIVETLVKRNYIERKKKTILATSLAFSLIDALPMVLKDPGMTALWEQQLENIATGKMKQSEFMDKQYNFIQQVIDTHKSTVLAQNSELKKDTKKKSYSCPECKSGELIKREGKNAKGKYTWFGCSNYSNGCKFTCFGDKKGNPVIKG